jgi:hypothetical protein
MKDDDHPDEEDNPDEEDHLIKRKIMFITIIK